MCISKRAVGAWTLGAALAVALTACGATKSVTGTTTVTTSAAVPAATSSSSEPVVEASSAEETTDPADTVAKVGSTGFKYSDGMTVAVLSITKARIGQYAAGGKPGDIGALIKVQITNGSDKVVDLDLTTISVTYGADGETAEQVYDMDAGADGFTGKVAPGKKATGKFLFAIPKANRGDELQVEVSPGAFDYESSLFSGKITG